MARGFGRRRGSFRRKRTVAWIPGIATQSDTAGAGLYVRRVTLSKVTTITNSLWTASIGVVIPSDLPMHGGEDLVLCRVVGSLGFWEGRVDSGAGNAATAFVLRAVIHQSDTVVAAGGGSTVTPNDFSLSAGMGADDILWFKDYVVTGTAVGNVGQGLDTGWGGEDLNWQINVKARRKVQEDRCVFLTLQTHLPAAAVGADFMMAGGLRSLVMRPR